MTCQDRTDNSRDQSQKHNSRFHYCFLFAVAVLMLFAVACATSPSSTDLTDTSNDQVEIPKQETLEAQHADIESRNNETVENGNSQTSLMTVGGPASYPTFPTFNNTGVEICTNEEGLPLIFMFSTSQCPHCRWAGSAFDFVVRFFTAEGLIEAHHYDLLSGDDLLTESVETEVPADKFELYKNGNPKDLVPYYNFGCVYDRVGNGYEKESDLVAEGEEMRRVIEALVQIVSGDE